MPRVGPAIRNHGYASKKSTDRPLATFIRRANSRDPFMRPANEIDE
jgi:hypothetical protein